MARNLALVLIAVAVIAVSLCTIAMYAGFGGERTVTVTRTETVTKSVTLARSTTPAGLVPAIRTSVRLVAAGATFPYPQLVAWIEEFHKQYPQITIEYTPTGSGEGQRRFFDKVVDFCGSDPPLKKSVWDKYRGEVMQVPYVLGAVVVVYNLPEIKGVHLNLTGEILAKIYRGDIAYWDDPEIKKLNPAVADKLPHREIIVVHRADASGTQQIFTTFLHKAAPTLWPSNLVSKLPRYPVAEKRPGKVMAGKGNQGVAQIVLNTPYSIGFVEWSYALETGMDYAAIANAYGEFILPSVESLMKAAAGAAKLLPKDPRDDFSKDLNYIVYAKAHGAYPLTSWSHLILWTRYPEDKARAIAVFLTWIAEHGEEHLVKGYAPPPKELKALLLKAAEMLVHES